MSDGKLFYRAEEVAAQLGISKRQFYNCITDDPKVYGADSSTSVRPRVKYASAAQEGGGARRRGRKSVPLWSSRLVALIADYRLVDQYGEPLMSPEVARKSRNQMLKKICDRHLDAAEAT